MVHEKDQTESLKMNLEEDNVAISYWSICPFQGRSHLKANNTTENTSIVEKLFICDLCSHLTTTCLGLLYHKILISHAANTFMCGQCDYTCRQKTDIRAHKDFNHDQTEYACNKCGHKTSTGANSSFITERSILASYDCPSCPTKTATPAKRTHIKTIHDKV